MYLESWRGTGFKAPKRAVAGVGAKARLWWTVLPHAGYLRSDRAGIPKQTGTTTKSEDDFDGSEACVEWLAVPCSAYLWLVVVEVIWMVVRDFRITSSQKLTPNARHLYHPTPGLTDVEGAIARWTTHAGAPTFAWTSPAPARRFATLPEVPSATTLPSRIFQLQNSDVALYLSIPPLNLALAVGCRG
ncbi:hypothetical protein DFP72DRAFT_1048262 [Ephemerocybe angulata]|uniref:Uncharacterized protein n=1 Tax=Ephemerocybe angulata TaxID=980116 RepID=A0A8H6HQB6_9AGAR|nr:hypothetical protein DFP72DRAFT_1048262 [Tulosesus angulatus]